MGASIPETEGSNGQLNDCAEHISRWSNHSDCSIMFGSIEGRLNQRKNKHQTIVSSSISGG